MIVEKMSDFLSLTTKTTTTPELLPRLKILNGLFVAVKGKVNFAS